MEQEPHKLPIRFYEIDLLRFLAALSVVLFHYTYRGYAEGNYSPIPFTVLGQFTRYGYLGVELFFLISGYVILLSAQGKTVRQFFVSRVMRLYPAFWVACTLTFLVEFFWGTRPADTHMPSTLHAGVGQYLYNMTMLHEFFGRVPVDAAYWSLEVEIAFYFLIAVVVGWKLMPHLDGFLLGWLAYAALAGPTRTTTPFFYLFFPHYAPYFIAGMLFYLLQKPEGRSWFRYAMLLAAYVLGVRAAAFRAVESSAFYHDNISPTVAMVAVSAFFVIFFLVSFRKVNLSRFTWLGTLGTLTYPLYLLHSNIGYVAFHRLGPQVNKYALLGGMLLIMLLAAYGVHVLIEKRYGNPFGKWLAAMLALLDKSNPQQIQYSTPTVEPKKKRPV